MDATATGYTDGEFDAVVCVFGVFFLPDMVAFIREMWRMVRPGGTLAITTWGPGWLEPASSMFWDAVRSLEPSLYKGFNPWDEITEPAALLDLFERAGIVDAAVEPAEGTQPLGPSRGLLGDGDGRRAPRHGRRPGAGPAGPGA